MNYINLVIAYMKQNWVTIAMIATVIWNYAAPTVTNYVANHPHLSFWYGLAAVIAAFYLKSPMQKPALKLGPSASQTYTPNK